MNLNQIKKLGSSLKSFFREMEMNETFERKSLGKDVVSYKFKTEKRDNESQNPKQRCVFTMQRVSELDTTNITPIKIRENIPM